ncbi:hypothetical protein DITRI_Ditri13aG0137200 [Diplodiscus trichospermus]
MAKLSQVQKHVHNRPRSSFKTIHFAFSSIVLQVWIKVTKTVILPGLMVQFQGNASAIKMLLGENEFFQEYNSRLLQSGSYITRRYAIKLLGNMLLDHSNSAVMLRYVTSLDNMIRIMINLLRDSNKTIKLDTFHVFKLFVANQNKPKEIISVLVTNKSNLLPFFGEFNIDKEDEQFEADKSQIIQEIATLQLTDRSCQDLDNCDVPC